MKTSTRNAVEITSALGRHDFTVASVEVHTPDGRTWSIDTTNIGRFRLFEIDRETGGSDEHDADDGEWSAGDLIDYLKAVGEQKSSTAPKTGDDH